DCAEEARVTGEAPSLVEVEMPLDVNCLDRRTAGLRLVGLEPPAAVGGLIGRYRNCLRDEASRRKGPHLLFPQHVRLALPRERFDNGSHFMIEYSGRQNQMNPYNLGLGGPFR